MTVYITGDKAENAPIKVTTMKVFSDLSSIIENKINSMINHRKERLEKYPGSDPLTLSIRMLNSMPQVYKCELDSFNKNNKVKDSEWVAAVQEFKDNNPDKIAKFLLETNVSD